MANTAKAQAIFKGMTSEQQQAFLNKQKTASAGDQAKVSAALKPIKPVVSTPAGTTPGAPTSTVPPSNTPTISTPPVEPVQDNTVGPADPVTPQIDKAKVAWAKMNADQQQEFATKHNFDPKKYGLEFAKGSAKPQQPIGQNNQTTPPQSTTPEAPAPVVSTQPNYQDNSTARLQEIRNNLDQQLQAAPSLFDDRPAFDATFNYALRSKEQQAVLNNFWYQKSQSDVFNNTPTDVLAGQIATGETSIDAFSFMKDKDPVKYAALQGAVTEANKKEALKSSLDPATFMQEFNERHDAAVKKIDEQESIINTAELIPAITQGKTELAGLKAEIDQIELDKAAVKAGVLAEYEGKGISKTLLNDIVSDRMQTLVDQGNSKILQYNSKLGAVNANMDQMKMFSDLEAQRATLEQQKFTNKLATVSAIYQQSNDKSQTVTNPISGLSYEKQPDGTWKQIDFGGPVQSSSSDSSSSTGDMSDLASKYPNEASFKNNNPTGIKITAASAELKKLWDDAGVKYSQGTNATDGGSFAKFATIEDGMKAYDIAMTQRWGRATVKTFLDSWGTGSSGTGLSSEVLGKTISSLTPEEKQEVQMAQIKKESPGLYKELFTETPTNDFSAVEMSAIQSYLKDPSEVNYNKYLVPNGLTKQDANSYKAEVVSVGPKGYNPDDSGVYKKYLSGAASKADYEMFGGKDVLSKQAAAWYKDSIDNRFSNTSFKVDGTFMDYYKNLSAPEQVKVDEGLGEVGSVIDNTDKLLDYLEHNGVPSSASVRDWSNYMGKIRPVQMTAKSENLFNLGVLNGADLDVLNDILPAGRYDVLAKSDEDVKEAIIAYRDYLITNFNAKGATKGLSFQYSGKYPTGTFVDQYGNHSDEDALFSDND